MAGVVANPLPGAPGGLPLGVAGVDGVLTASPMSVTDGPADRSEAENVRSPSSVGTATYAVGFPAAFLSQTSVGLALVFALTSAVGIAVPMTASDELALAIGSLNSCCFVPLRCSATKKRSRFPAASGGVITGELWMR